MSVSQARCLLKGVAGHSPRRVLVTLAGGDCRVKFCIESCTTGDSRGVERVRLVAISVKSGRLFEIIVDE